MADKKPQYVIICETSTFRIFIWIRFLMPTTGRTMRPQTLEAYHMRLSSIRSRIMSLPVLMSRRPWRASRRWYRTWRMREVRNSAHFGIRKYQFMEVNQQRRAAGLKDKMPDIQKTLDTVRFLKTRKVGRIPNVVQCKLTAFASRTRIRSKQHSS